MAANKEPIFTRTPDVQWGTLVAANTAFDGTGTVVTVFTADATEGGYVERLRLSPQGTQVATGLKIFLNNGSTNATAANNTLLDQYTLPASTSSLTGGMTSIEIPLGLALPPGYKINLAISTAVAVGWSATVIGGKY